MLSNPCVQRHLMVPVFGRGDSTCPTPFATAAFVTHERFALLSVKASSRFIDIDAHLTLSLSLRNQPGLAGHAAAPMMPSRFFVRTINSV
jgi:hypothetical protein